MQRGVARVEARKQGRDAAPFVRKYLGPVEIDAAVIAALGHHVPDAAPAEKKWIRQVVGALEDDAWSAERAVRLDIDARDHALAI